MKKIHWFLSQIQIFEVTVVVYTPRQCKQAITNFPFVVKHKRCWKKVLRFFSLEWDSFTIMSHQQYPCNLAEYAYLLFPCQFVFIIFIWLRYIIYIQDSIDTYLIIQLINARSIENFMQVITLTPANDLWHKKCMHLVMTITFYTNTEILFHITSNEIRCFNVFKFWDLNRKLKWLTLYFACNRYWLFLIPLVFTREFLSPHFPLQVAGYDGMTKLMETVSSWMQ